MFVSNCWYVIAWAGDLSKESLLGRTILGKPLIAYRNDAGDPVVMDDRCCHRHAPLSMGRLEADGVRCMYHGLKFDHSGRCIEIPGQDRIADSMRVKSWPVFEQDEFIWVWMGAAEQADPENILRFPLHSDPGWRYRPSRFHVKANHQLITDNVLDFTHLAWTHLETFGTSGAATIMPELTPGESGIRLKYVYRGTELTEFHRNLTGWSGTVDRTHELDWTAPVFLQVRNTYTPGDVSNYTSGYPGPLVFRSSHAFTPETETTTWYFWTHANPVDAGGEEELDFTYNVVRHGFGNEDLPIIEAQQANILLDPQARMHSIQYDAAPNIARRMNARLRDLEAR